MNEFISPTLFRVNSICFLITETDRAGHLIKTNQGTSRELDTSSSTGDSLITNQSLNQEFFNEIIQ